MKKKKNPVLIGCLVVGALFLCCALSAGGYWGYEAYQANVCYEDAYDIYYEKWNEACKAAGTYDENPDDCQLPQDISDPLNRELEKDEAECGWFMSEYSEF